MDQNSNMGGFSPMPGQAPAFGAGPAPSPAPQPSAGMPGMGVMPGVQPAAAPAGPQAAAPAAPAKNNTLVETLILVVVCIIAAVSIVFAVIFFMQHNELQANFDSQKNAAVAEAVAEQQQIDTAKFAEDEKMPFYKFTGPSDYGSVSFEYPKTWSVYVASDGTNNSDYEAYFHPSQVDPVSDENSRFALRFKILNQQINSVQTEYESRVTEGMLTSNIFSAGNNITGTRYEGTLAEEINGIAILIKINDKTAILQTDSRIYENDFNTLISKLRRNS